MKINFKLIALMVQAAALVPQQSMAEIVDSELGLPKGAVITSTRVAHNADGSFVITYMPGEGPQYYKFSKQAITDAQDDVVRTLYVPPITKTDFGAEGKTMEGMIADATEWAKGQGRPYTIEEAIAARFMIGFDERVNLASRNPANWSTGGHNTTAPERKLNPTTGEWENMNEYVDYKNNNEAAVLRTSGLARTITEGPTNLGCETPTYNNTAFRGKYEQQLKAWTEDSAAGLPDGFTVTEAADGSMIVKYPPAMVIPGQYCKTGGRFQNTGEPACFNTSRSIDVSSIGTRVPGQPYIPLGDRDLPIKVQHSVTLCKDCIYPKDTELKNKITQMIVVVPPMKGVDDHEVVAAEAALQVAKARLEESRVNHERYVNDPKVIEAYRRNNESLPPYSPGVLGTDVARAEERLKVLRADLEKRQAANAEAKKKHIWDSILKVPSYNVAEVVLAECPFTPVPNGTIQKASGEFVLPAGVTWASLVRKSAEQVAEEEADRQRYLAGEYGGEPAQALAGAASAAAASGGVAGSVAKATVASSGPICAPGACGGNQDGKKLTKEQKKAQKAAKKLAQKEKRQAAKLARQNGQAAGAKALSQKDLGKQVNNLAANIKWDQNAGDINAQQAAELVAKAEELKKKANEAATSDQVAAVKEEVEAVKRELAEVKSGQKKDGANQVLIDVEDARELSESDGKQGNKKKAQVHTAL